MSENTEQEQQLLQFLKQDDMKEAEQVFAKMAGLPVVGKLFAALVALGDYESIAAFRRSEHYHNLKDWNFAIDFDKNSLYITPNSTQIIKAIRVLAIISAVISLMLVLRRVRRMLSAE